MIRLVLRWVLTDLIHRTRPRAVGTWHPAHENHQATHEGHVLTPCERHRETPWFCWRLGLLDSDQGLVGPWVIVERSFEFRGWDITEVAVEAGGVVPLDPAEGAQLVVFDGLPRAGAGGPVDQFGLVVAVDRLGKSIVPRHQLRLIRLVISELSG
jgi:hypothetical protein